MRRLVLATRREDTLTRIPKCQGQLLYRRRAPYLLRHEHEGEALVVAGVEAIP